MHGQGRAEHVVGPGHRSHARAGIVLTLDDEHDDQALHQSAVFGLLVEALPIGLVVLALVEVALDLARDVPLQAILVRGFDLGLHVAALRLEGRSLRLGDELALEALHHLHALLEHLDLVAAFLRGELDPHASQLLLAEIPAQVAHQRNGQRLPLVLDRLDLGLGLDLVLLGLLRRLRLGRLLGGLRLGGLFGLRAHAGRLPFDGLDEVDGLGLDDASLLQRLLDALHRLDVAQLVHQLVRILGQFLRRGGILAGKLSQRHVHLLQQDGHPALHADVGGADEIEVLPQRNEVLEVRRQFDRRLGGLLLGLLLLGRLFLGLRLLFVLLLILRVGLLVVLLRVFGLGLLGVLLGVCLRRCRRGVGRGGRCGIGRGCLGLGLLLRLLGLLLGFGGLVGGFVRFRLGSLRLLGGDVGLGLGDVRRIRDRWLDGAADLRQHLFRERSLDLGGRVLHLLLGLGGQL